MVNDEVFSPFAFPASTKAVHNLIIESAGWTMEMKNDMSAAVRN